MRTKKDVFTINQIKDILQIHEQSTINFFKSTLDRMDKRISDLIEENAVLKIEIVELKKSLQFHTDQRKENFKTLDNMKSELLQNQKCHQQQKQLVIIPDLKEIKDKLEDLENRSGRNNLRIDGIIEEENESWSQSEQKLQEIIKDQLQFERDIENERAYRFGKTTIDRVANKRRTIVAKFLNLKDEQEVLSEYKARKLWTKGIFKNEDFSEDTMEKRKGLFQSAKELREEGKFAKVVYDRLIVRDKTSRLENTEEGDSSVWDISL